MRTLIITASSIILSGALVAQTPAPSAATETMRGARQIDAYDRAIAPHVAKARATYPAAKKRFLAGLPPGHTFGVMVRLYERAEKAREQRYEDVLVGVKTIKNGIVYGWINSKPVQVANHRQGERVQFPESEIMNWLIVHPDGTEEGNFVGKFLDRWKPPKA